MAGDLQVLAASADLPVSLEDAKSHLRVAMSDHADDALITRMIFAASVDAAQECGRSFGVSEFRLTLDRFPDFRHHYMTTISLPIRPIVELSNIRYYNCSGVAQTMSDDEYYVGYRTGTISAVGTTWPATQAGRPESVSVDFRAGEPVLNIPHQAWQAILLILADRYEHRGDGDDRRRPVPESALRLLRQLHSGVYV